jgi:hypothetical protein
MSGAPAAVHEFFRPWLLWDRGFDLAPKASRDFAQALWNHQIANPKTGAFNRHASFGKSGATDGMDFARHAGFYIRTWAVAYARTKDEAMLRAVTVLLERYENKRDAKTGLIEAYSGQSNALPILSLSLAMDCEGAAHRVPEPLASRLRAFAAREDQIFLGLPHDPKAAGFVTVADKAAGGPAGQRTSLWSGRYGGCTTAQAGMMCVSRYDNTGQTGYRDLLLAAAEAYLTAMPADDEDVWPMTAGQAISLELAAWRHSARAAYFDRARALGEWAVRQFWGDRPLPQASLKRDHYETITGADTLALALTELHLNILHITAVRCPANTLDR